ncbi:hypothetical protein L249_2807 [Ophiocordyceps polyrhachis-furcata BCC 54312]|uniref:G-patch domain-containing protein n=1 Tax=Ophiocordyceps polyrhachis-furcata BCC 54312 TaxID=1330021 RepID=A0A367LP96_9HYPO|nr:hypothetical protein L249_2807 [Ophiocordyceps polyrhachis-furcata BCC 54312]
MSHKRSRATFEADSSAPYAVFGTPLPDDTDSRDDGSFVPIWKQEARDENGRKRLHGAFTGGWSAGYFNTVGSKEGWTPSSFVSSRSSRRKDGSKPVQQRAEDYMDEEDLADAAEAQKLHTSPAFAALGASAQQQQSRPRGLLDLLRAEGNTMGTQLLRRMGWKDGQGIGPKVRRSARLDLGRESAPSDGETFLFAPENTPMVRLARKTDRKGLGHQAEVGLQAIDHRKKADDDDGSDDELTGMETADNRANRSNLATESRGRSRPRQGAFGVGVLNDTGSDDEDPYEIGPKIKYNRSIGGNKKKKGKKMASSAANPGLANAPKFVPKVARAGGGLRRCHDGRLPLDGFEFAKLAEDLGALLAQYAPPPVPAGWKSAKDVAATTVDSTRFASTADAAKASSLNPSSRAALLGEATLPGKSVFDYLSKSAREKLVAASGRSDLPPAGGETPVHDAMSGEERQRWLADQIPTLDRNTATAALSRASGGPYSEDEPKRMRYRRYLEHQLNPSLPLPCKVEGMSDKDFLQELNEFRNCARIFKPMTGFMASRFTTSKSSSSSGPSGSRGASDAEPVSVPEGKPADPAEEAARLGMFGHMTRSVEDFYPTQLLCKRFNVKAPAHARPDNEPPEDGSAGATTGKDDSRPDSPPAASGSGPGLLPAPEKIDADKNEAVEGATANADLLRAIFGDSDSE